MRDKKSQAPRPITTEDHHDKIIDVFRRYKPGRILDACCGEGALTVRLEELGYDVSCCDIQPDLCKIPGKEVLPCDLNQRIPFEDNTFDYIACTNVLHRLYGFDRAVSEIARVLKPGGTAIISLPNYSSITRRMRYLFLGSISDAVNTQKCRGNSTAPEANFRNSLILPQLVLCLERHRLRIDHLEQDRFKRTSFFFAPLALPIYIGSWLTARPRRRDNRRLRWANHPMVLLGGPHIVIVAQKDAA
ncbi:MAG: class I SAM-dependent methyltransferase [Deltaproteobacteria bacterium]|nr:class I SAM-dependent methyltransferase [Deltaproteobacteria bacterium]